MKKAKIKKKKSVRPSVTAKKPKTEKPVGAVLHYFTKIKVAVVKFKQTVRKGAPIRFEGATTNFRQKADSMQFNHKTLERAPKGKKVGVKVVKRVREGDRIYAA